MTRILVPVFTEEYKIVVVVGKIEELAKYVSKNCHGWEYDDALQHCKDTRGSAFNLLSDSHMKHPLITLDIDLPLQMALATLPHEASHCVDFLFDHLGIVEKSGELRGHIISAVVRITLEKLLKGKEIVIKKKKT